MELVDDSKVIFLSLFYVMYVLIICKDDKSFLLFAIYAGNNGYILFC